MEEPWLIIWITIIFLILIGISTLIYSSTVLKERCEWVGGHSDYLGTSCLKEVDGDYVNGRTTKINDKWVFVRK